jgi:phosphoribosylanthranilate isomerase
MNGRVRVKICGITRAADAQCAAAAGVDALGFIFYAKSPRHIEAEAARQIIAQLPPLVAAVGVFVNEEMARVEAVVRGCGLQYAQLHGGESPEYCRELAARAGCRVLKAIRVGPATTAADIAPYRGAVCGFLLDTFHQDAVGGTGAVFDWALIDRLELDRPFLLAGGLSADNIAAALAEAQPFGVDANSGLEQAPGIKDHDLIQRFMALVRAAATSPQRASSRA